MQVKPYKKNAKKHPDKQLKKIAASLREFGWQQPIVVDKEGVIIVGHGRWKAYQKYSDGIEPPEIKVANLSPEQAKAYRLADNKLNESAWQLDLAVEDLSELSREMFELTGFDDSVFGKKSEFENPEIEFSEELLLEHNYVVLYFDNQFDWQVACDKFGLKLAKSIAPEGSQKIGIGRVIKGKDIIDKL